MVAAVLSLPNPLALAWLALMAALVAAPVSEPSGGGLSERFARFSLAAAAEHFPVKVIFDDEKALLAAAAAPPPPPRPGCHAPAADAAAAAAVARFVVGYEPHSALPLGLPISMCDLSPVCPGAFLPRRVVVVDSGAAAAARAAANRNSGATKPALGFAALRSPRPSTSLKTVGGIRVLASSAFMCVPIVRHLWYWIGNREASAASMRAILRSGKSVALCPGGEWTFFFPSFFFLVEFPALSFLPFFLSRFSLSLFLKKKKKKKLLSSATMSHRVGVRECRYLRNGQETVYIRKRTGFVRIALQEGAPIVPAFAFGQTSAYSFWVLGPPLLPRKVVNALARALRCMPLLMWGAWGSPVPHARPLTVVVGAPISHGDGRPIGHPSEAVVREVLDRYVEAIRGLHARHAEAAGAKGVPLTVL
jgi:2-acylglycerol O-acyltransferase 2